MMQNQFFFDNCNKFQLNFVLLCNKQVTENFGNIKLLIPNTSTFEHKSINANDELLDK